MPRHRLPALLCTGAVLLAALVATQAAYTFAPIDAPVPEATATAAPMPRM